jgi:hypothetical protein
MKNEKTKKSKYSKATCQVTDFRVQEIQQNSPAQKNCKQFSVSRNESISGITRNDVALILIDKKPGISMDEIIKKTLRLDKPLELKIANNYLKSSLIRNSVDEMVSMGFVKETTERYGDTKNVSYSLTDDGRKVYEDRLGKLIIPENPKLANKLNKYLGL